jgi:hypothetical protein
MVPGIPIKMADGRYFLVPALTLTELLQQADKLKKFEHFATYGWLQADASTIGAVLDVATVAIRRNYPMLTRDEMPDLLDIRSAERTIAALLGRGEYVDPPEDDAETAAVRELADRYLGLQLQGRVADA